MPPCRLVINLSIFSVDNSGFMIKLCAFVVAGVHFMYYCSWRLKCSFFLSLGSYCLPLQCLISEVSFVSIVQQLVARLVS